MTTRWLRGLLSLVCLLGIVVSPIAAQAPAVPSDALGWTLSGSGNSASFYTFAIRVDGTRSALTGVTCAADANLDLQCRAPLPAMTPGRHTIEVIAIFTSGSTVAESDPSEALALTLIAVVTPTGLRLIKG